MIHDSQTDVEGIKVHDVYNDSGSDSYYREDYVTSGEGEVMTTESIDATFAGGDNQPKQNRNNVIV